jgi:hypothetical protein
MKTFDPAMPMSLWAALRVRELVARRMQLAALELLRQQRREQAQADDEQ